jgi:hypothetical protein
VVISLVGARDTVAATALTNDAGLFEIRAPGPGTFLLDAKRIGVRRTRIPAFSIAAGETVQRNVEIEPVPVVIASMRVIGTSQCLQRPDENERTAALWEDARAALTATMIARRSRSPVDSVVRFTRKLDATTWRVLFEERHRVPASMDRPFRSLPADELSRDGYVRSNADGTTSYYAPDADVLLSNSFLVDHCFRVQRGAGPHAAHVGLAFEPIPGRRAPEVRGVLWLDGKSAELRTLDFTYTWLPHEARPDDYGGTVTFFRTLTGRWIVRSWRIRMPEFGFERWTERANGERLPLEPSRTPHVVRVLEEGGAVPVAAIVSETGTVRGTVIVDTTSRRPVEGATVLLAGSSAEGVSDANGRFTIPLVPPGSYTVVLLHAALDSLGIEHLAAVVDVGMGSVSGLTVAFPSLGELAARLCEGKSNLDREAVVRLIVADSTGLPLHGARVLVSRRRQGTDPNAADSAVTMFDGVLDDRGAYVACGVPSGEMLRIESAKGAVPAWSSAVPVKAGIVGWYLVRAPRGG